jgi:hypothetical protein
MWSFGMFQGFNTKKCYVLSINNKSSRYYQLEKHTLQEVQENPYLGLKISNDLKWSIHINNVWVGNRRQINGQTSWHSLEGHLYGIRTLSDRVQYLEALQSTDVSFELSPSTIVLIVLVTPTRKLQACITSISHLQNTGTHYLQTSPKTPGEK